MHPNIDDLLYMPREEWLVRVREVLERDVLQYVQWLESRGEDPQEAIARLKEALLEWPV